MEILDKVVWLIERQLEGMHWAFLAGLLLILLVLHMFGSYCLGHKDECHRAWGRTIMRVNRILVALLYLCFVLDVTLFQDGKPNGSIVLRPFDTESWLDVGEPYGFHERRLFHYLLNGVLFLPLGAMIRAIVPQKSEHRRMAICVIAVSFVFSSLIEICQYIGSVGSVLADVTIVRTIAAYVGWRLSESMALRMKSGRGC